MRSIPAAMTWELLVCNRWWMLASALWAYVFPAFVFSALQRSGGIDHSAEAGFVTMHVTFVLISMFAFGATVCGTQARMVRLYALPVATTELLVWRLLPALTTVFLQTFLSIFCLNAVFALDWPLWGPAWFSAVAFGLMLVSFWLLESSPVMPLGIAVVGTLLALWFKSRYGATFSMPDHMWTALSVGDVASFCAGGLAIAVVGRWAVARNRRGDSLPIYHVPGEAVPPAGVPADRPFKSADWAQFWYDWRRAGWIFPGIVIVGMAVGLLIWGLFVQKVDDLYAGFVGGGAMFSVAAILIGLAVGHPGTNPQRQELGNFAAARPVASSTIARWQLNATACSVFTAWLIWLVPYLGLSLALYLAGISVPLQATNEFWLWPAVVLVGSWTLATLTGAIQLSGRSHFVPVGIFGAFAVWAVLAWLAPHLPRPVLLAIGWILLASCGLALLGGIGWLFAASWRRRLASPLALSLALAAAVAATATNVYLAITQPNWMWPGTAVFMSLWALLAVAPVATYPVALAWNRVR